MSSITVNGVELELDLMDADVMEKYETLNQEVVDKVKEPTQYQGLSNAEGMRLQCRHVDNFFDKLFGDGTAQKIFGGGNNLGVRLDAFAQVSQMSGDIDKRVNELTNKYGINRIDRRKGPQDFHRKRQKQRYNNRSNWGK